MFPPNLNILIIEDEKNAARRLQRQLELLLPSPVIAEPISTVEEAIEILSMSPGFDLIFMDVHLADGDSFDILDQLQIHTPIIFTTAYDEYAIQAFKVNSIAYLLKPVRQDELLASLQKWESIAQLRSVVGPENSSNKQPPDDSSDLPTLRRLLVKFPEKIKVVEVESVAYFFVSSRIILMQLFDGGTYPVDFNLDQLEKRLDNTQFFRANRQCIVNARAVRQLHTFSKSRLKLELTPPLEEDVFVSSEKAVGFKKWLMGMEA